MNGAQPEDRLPATVGGLIGFAATAYAAHAPLYLALALLAFAIDGIVQAIAPDRIPAQFAASIVGDALLVAAVAIGVGSRATGTSETSGKLFEAAIVRWGDVAGAGAIAAIFSLFVLPVAVFASGFAPMAFVAAPMAWLLVGALSLAGPVTALGNDRPILAALTGFWRAMFLSLRIVNIPRLLAVSTAAVIAVVLEMLAVTALKGRVPHLEFWAGAPIDALLTGPLAALQAAFALDFARRLRTSAPPPAR